MSTLWTPGGEHHVPRNPQPAPAGTGRFEAPPASVAREGGSGRPSQRLGPTEPSPEELRQAQEEMDAVREQLVRAPVEVVIANHAMGLWELGALHLSQRPPNLEDAKLAIDALGAIVEGLEGRLGEPEKVLSDGLAEIRMAFVQIANVERSRQDGAEPASGGGAPGRP